MTAVLYKVYCYRGTDKQIWFEVEDSTTGQGVAWSPSLSTVVKKAKKLGYALDDEARPVIKFYRARASSTSGAQPAATRHSNRFPLRNPRRSPAATIFSPSRHPDGPTALQSIQT